MAEDLRHIVRVAVQTFSRANQHLRGMKYDLSKLPSLRMEIYGARMDP